MNKFVSAALAIALFGSSSSAMATVNAGSYTFDFTGLCADCSGFGDAVLKVQDYIPGSQLDNANFVSFSYDGTNKLAPYTITNLYQSGLSGSINLAPGFDNVSIFGSSTLGPDTIFQTQNSGYWQTGQIALADRGIFGTWSLASTSAVPEPATWALMLTGFGLVGYAMRKRAEHSVALA